nr:MAG TPA: hypothetical protein [Caudoviricetes sp.]
MHSNYALLILFYFTGKSRDFLYNSRDFFIPNF